MSDRNATPGQVVPLSTLVTIFDPGNLGYQALELFDSKGTVAGGEFVVNGVAQNGGYVLKVSPANVANTVFDVGTSGVTDTLKARLLLDNGTLTAWQPFTVVDPVTVAQGAAVELASYAGVASFAGTTGTLRLDDAAGFTGTIAGFGARDRIDLPSIAFNAHATLGYSENSSDTGGTLSVKDGAFAAKVALLGNYMAASFVTTTDGHGGTLVTEAAQTESQHPLLTTPH